MHDDDFEGENRAEKEPPLQVVRALELKFEISIKLFSSYGKAMKIVFFLFEYVTCISFNDNNMLMKQRKGSAEY